MMGGRIWINNDLGKKNTFHFTVDLEMPIVRPASGSAKASIPDILRDREVLVVDDNAANRRVLEGILTACQMRPALASSTDDAINFLRQPAAHRHCFDLHL